MSELKADKTFVFGEECEAYKKWRDEHKEIYNARMRAYRKNQKAQKQAQDH